MQYLRRGLHPGRFDPSGRLIEPMIWIYAGLNIEHCVSGCLKNEFDCILALNKSNGSRRESIDSDSLLLF